MRKSKPIKPRACAMYYASKMVTKVFYACPNCHLVTDRLLEDDLLYCHRCGQRWDRRVVSRINGDTSILQAARKKDWDFDDKVLKQLNDDLNKRIRATDTTKSYELDMHEFVEYLKEADLL